MRPRTGFRRPRRIAAASACPRRPATSHPPRGPCRPPRWRSSSRRGTRRSACTAAGTRARRGGPASPPRARWCRRPARWGRLGVDESPIDLAAAGVDLDDPVLRLVGDPDRAAVGHDRTGAVPELRTLPCGLRPQVELQPGCCAVGDDPGVVAGDRELLREVGVGVVRVDDRQGGSGGSGVGVGVGGRRQDRSLTPRRRVAVSSSAATAPITAAAPSAAAPRQPALALGPAAAAGRPSP